MEFLSNLLYQISRHVVYYFVKRQDFPHKTIFHSLLHDIPFCTPSCAILCSAKVHFVLDSSSFCAPQLHDGAQNGTAWSTKSNARVPLLYIAYGRIGVKLKGKTNNSHWGLTLKRMPNFPTSYKANLQQGHASAP